VHLLLSESQKKALGCAAECHFSQVPAVDVIFFSLLDKAFQKRRLGGSHSESG